MMEEPIIEHGDGTRESIEVIKDDLGENIVIITPEFPDGYGEAERNDFMIKGQL